MPAVLAIAAAALMAGLRLKPEATLSPLLSAAQVTCGRQPNTKDRLLSRSEALQGRIFRFRRPDADLDARSHSIPVRA